MIWHFLEVWLSLIAAFLIGCTIGALIYDILARTRLATAQGAIVDSIGDVFDRIKDQLGVGPAWRPRRRVAAWEAEGSEGPPNQAAYPAREGNGDARIAATRTDDEAVGAETTSAGSADEPAPGAVDVFAAPIRASDDVGLPALESPSRAGAIAAPAVADQPQSLPAPPAQAIIPKRPATLAEPRNGVPDNLQRIRGIGERNEMRLNALGIFHFGQIAAWTPAEMQWVGQRLAFPERMERDDWIGQAIVLASGGETGITKAAERRRARRQQQRMSAAASDDDEDDEDYDDEP